MRATERAIDRIGVIIFFETTIFIVFEVASPCVSIDIVPCNLVCLAAISALGCFDHIVYLSNEVTPNLRTSRT